VIAEEAALKAQKWQWSDIRPTLNNFLGRNWLMLLAIIPLFRILVLTSSDGDFTNWQLSWRIFWSPSLYVELAVIIIALLHKMSPASMFSTLSRPVQYISGIWLVAVIAASSLAAFPTLAIASAINWIVHLLFAASAVHLFRCFDADLASMIQKFCLTLATCAALAGTAIIAFVIITGVDSGYDWKSSLPGFAHIRHTGYIFAPAIAAGLASLAIWPKFQIKPHLFVLMINTTAMLWLGSRGPAVALIAAIVITMIFSPQLRNRLFWTRIGAAIPTGCILSILLPAPAIGWFGAIQRFWNASGEPSDISSGRTDIWLETIRLIGEQPWLGYGGLQFQQINSAAEGFFKHPHNSVLQFIFDWGLLGGTAMLLLLAIAYFRLLLDKRIPSELRTFGVLGASTMLAFSMLDGVLFYNFTIAVTIIFLLLPLASINPHGMRASDHQSLRLRD
jgi:O-antigen ligase